MTLLPNKNLISYPINLRASYSVFIGALARIDFLSGDDKYFTFFIPPHVTLHKTQTLKADSVLENHSGTLLRPVYSLSGMELVKHEISLNCNDFKEANFDISIEGLGWFSVQGKGFITIMLHLPE